MDWLIHYSFFLVCTITIVLAFLAIIAGIIAITKKPQVEGEVSITSLNKFYSQLEDKMRSKVLSKSDYAAWKKNHKKKSKAQKKSDKAKKKSNSRDDASAPKEKPSLYLIPFEGDMRARQVLGLTKMIDAVLLVAKPEDDVMVSITSGGGVVHGYGLAASELERLVAAKLTLTAAVDKVAASGGYMMAAVAHRIIAAPFAILGSIGVIAQLPNFNRWLKKHGIDFEQITAGEYKRTLTTFGENTDSDREKMQQELDETHVLFKNHIKKHRPDVDVDKVGTGEHWYGSQALELGLVDQCQTQADYVLQKRESHRIFLLGSKEKKSFFQKLNLTSMVRHLYANTKELG